MSIAPGKRQRLEGTLLKQGGFLKAVWQSRYFVLAGNQILYQDTESSKVKGKIPLTNAQVTLYDTNSHDQEHAFGIMPAGAKRNYILAAESLESLSEWVSMVLQSGATYAPSSKTLAEAATAERASHFSTMEGYLWKSGNSVLLTSYKRRFFVLEQGALRYYRGHDKAALMDPIRAIDLTGASVSLLPPAECAEIHVGMPAGAVPASAHQNVLSLRTASEYVRTFLLIAQSDALAETWLTALRAMIREASGLPATPAPRASASRTRAPSRSPEPAPPSPLSPLPEAEPGRTTRVKQSREPSAAALQLYIDCLANPTAPVPAGDAFEQLTQHLAQLGVSGPQHLLPLQRAPAANILTPALLDVAPMAAQGGVCSGWLLRLQENGEWRLRWTVVTRTTHALRYWDSPTSLRTHSKPLKTALLLAAVIEPSTEACPFAPANAIFTVNPARAFGDGSKGRRVKPLVFAAPTQALRDRWLHAMRAAASETDQPHVHAHAEKHSPAVDGDNAFFADAASGASRPCNAQPSVDTEDCLPTRRTQTRSSASTAETTSAKHRQANHSPSAVASPAEAPISVSEEESKREATAALVRQWEQQCRGEAVPMLVSLHVIFPQAPQFPQLQHQLDQGRAAADFDPSEVKSCFHDAARYVHPDKMAADALLGERIMSEAVFAALREAFAKFRVM